MIDKNVNVLIADDETNQYLHIKKILESNKNIKVIGFAKDGIKAYNMILDLSPDVAIIDGIMPKLDGLGILKKLNLNNNKETKCIIISPLANERVIKKSLELGADYYMLKPFDPYSLIERIDELQYDNQDNQNKKLNAEYNKDILCKDTYIQNNFYDNKNIIITVTETLHNLGIPAHIRGYHYVRDAIILSLNNLDLLKYITKELYPTIAKNNKTTSGKVERAIRHAIEVAWNRGDQNTIEKFFGYSINKNKGKPTNSEFIALIVDTIILNKNKILEIF